MKKIISKIYLCLAFSYLIIYFSSFIFLKSNILNYITGGWLYLFVFILILFFIAFITILPPIVNNLEPNKALILLFIYSILSGILFITFPKVFTIYVINNTIGFLIFSLILAVVGLISIQFKINLLHTVSMSILVIIILAVNFILGYFSGSSFNMVDSTLLDFILFYFIFSNIFHIMKLDCDIEYVPNYTLLVSINYIHFFLTIARIIPIKKNNSNDHE